MGYVAYETESTRKLNMRTYKSAAAAKAAVTRAACKGNIDPADYSIAEVNDFYTNIEKKVVRTNLLSGQEYEEGVNTPSYMSPASESYWSM